jgi:cation:H+ antiporter
MAYFQILGGLVLLIFAGDFMVRGAVSVAQRLGVPTLLIGLTIVAFGTSAPELVVGIDAVLSGVPALALGNVVGSNIANIWLVLGVPAIIAPMVCHAAKFTQNMMVMLGVTVIFMALAFTGIITLASGLVLLILLLAFLYHSGKRAQEAPDYETLLVDIEGVPDKTDSPFLSIVLIIGGIIGLVLGAHLLVDGSVVVARKLGVSEAVIGLSLVAFGTSVPELATSIVAAIKKECDVAIGNVIGSNIFNLLGIIGVSSMFGNIPVAAHFTQVDLWVMLGASLTLLPFALYKWRIGRRAGFVFCTLYGLYIISIIYKIPGTA